MEIKNYLFRGFALFVFLLGVFLVPIKEANALSMTEFNARLSQLQQQFKDGEYWHYADNVSGDIRGGSTGYTLLYTSSSITKHHGDKSCSTSCVCKCGRYYDAADITQKGSYVGGQCHGYACTIGKLVFGSNPMGSEWEEHRDVNRLQPGDLVRYTSTSGGEHTIFITGVNGDNITFTECNHWGPCLVKWNISTSTDRDSNKRSKSFLSGRVIFIKHNKNGVISTEPVTPVEEPGVQVRAYNVPLTCYTVSEGNVTTYTSAGGNAVSGYITGRTDECKITEVYVNGRVRVDYPTPQGIKTAYANLSDFISSAHAVSNYGYSVSSNTTVYRRCDLSQSFGTAYPSDSITVVGETNGRLQIIYPISGGYKLGWINGTTSQPISGPTTDPSNIDTRYPTPIKAYTNASGNVTTYSAVNGGSTGAIFASDLCVINEVYTNGWCKVTYPTSGNDKTAYTQFSNFLDTSCQVTPESYRPGQTLTVYKRRNLSETFGSVWTSDSCILVAKSGTLQQLIYPLDAGGYKMGWVSLPVDIPTVDWPMPLKCYINSSTQRASVYEGIDYNAGYGQIFVDDECIINAVYTNGWVNVTYPISSGTKTGYVPVSVFVPNGITVYEDKASKQITSYKKSDMAETYGWADAGDSLVIVGKSGGKVQMIYPISSGYKLGWAYEGDFARTLTSISITTKPNKLTYMEGQEIDYTGLQVTATYSDRTTSIVTNYSKGGYSSTPGEKTITITYSEGGVTKTAAFSVTVNAKKPKSLALTKAPSRTTYLEGQADFDFSDMELTVTYDNGATANVNSYELFGMSSEVGTHVITIKFTENGYSVSTSFFITVKPRSLISLYPMYYAEEPELIVVENGGTLNLNTVLQVTAVYDNGDREAVNNYTVEGFDAYTPGLQSILLSYGGKSVNITVRVLEPETEENVMTDPDMKLPYFLTRIEAGAFQGCAAKWIKMGERITYIGEYAFADCQSLTQIYIPYETSFISATAFNGLSQKLTIYGMIGSYAEFYASKNGYKFVAVD